MINASYKRMIEKLREYVSNGVRPFSNNAGERNERIKTWNGYAYQGAADFVLKHGIFADAEPWRMDFGKPGAPKKCFANALIRAGVHGWKYFEGFAIDPHGVAALHAWNVDAAGRLIDSTWLNTGVVYYGVEFSLERADDATWNGDACVLDDFRRAYPIFREIWQGELDAAETSRQFPDNPRLSALRGRDSAALLRAFRVE